ncbi:CAP domain-containing protein [Clostridium sp. D53t1_180928_C8]|uniref:CAP domain-containing protein n=1 Tax=Clostridium sp. D53t1_180928_C8 TaxID=2787101 RepID=UPI0018A98327|nr:CAP domain-containing protein [Clostridium sp. D53t1_180928_C8]
MKNKLIASIVTLTVLGGAGTSTFAAVKDRSQEKSNINIIKLSDILGTSSNSKNGCSISGSLLNESNFKGFWWGNGQHGTIIIGGTINRPNNGSGSNGTVNPPSGDIETPNTPDTPAVDETPSTPDTPSVDQTPSTPDTPSVDETPSVPDTPVVDETPSVPDAPVVDETPSVDNGTSTSTNFMAQVEQAIFNKVNEERAKAGVPALTYNTTMEKYARIKSQDMGDNNYFSHEDLSGNLITTQMKKDGVTYRAWGENIAYVGGMTDPNAIADKIMTKWMNSSGHRANILSTNFSSIGVGVYKSGNRVYATQEFYK